jgi:hypothetical protein
MLLTVAQMPTGWAVDNSPGSGFGCLSHLLEPSGVKQTAYAAVTFADNGSPPQFQERLATYEVPAGRAFAPIVAALSRCRRVSGTKDDRKATATIGAMSFPRYGDQSAAFAVSLQTQGISAGEDILIVRKRNVVAGFAESDLGSPDLIQFQGFVRKALAKVSATVGYSSAVGYSSGVWHGFG